MRSLWSAWNCAAPRPRRCEESRARPRSSRGVERSRIGRDHAEQGLHGARHLVHEAPELVVGLGVARRVARELAPILIVVVPLREVIARLSALKERRERALERQDVQAVARQLEVADDLGPQQAHHVGVHGKPEAGKDLLGHRRAAHALAALEHQHALAGAGEIRGALRPLWPPPMMIVS